MKIPHFLIFSSLLLLLSLAACDNKPTTEPEGEKAPADSTEQSAPIGEAADKEKLEDIIQQYDPPGRVIWQKPEIVIDKMGDLSSKTVADLGAGSGFFSRRLAQQAKKVIALELDPRLIHFMDSIKLVELKPEYQARFETRRVTPTDSKLNPGEADIVLIVNTYIYIKDRLQYLRHLLDVLPKGGKVIIVDFKKKRMPIKYPPVNVRLELFEVENELDAVGFSRIESDDRALDFQYIIMAEK